MSFFLRLNIWLQCPGLTWLSMYLRVHQFIVLREDYHEPLPEITELLHANRRHHQGHPCTVFAETDLNLSRLQFIKYGLISFFFYFIIFSFYLTGGSTPKWLNTTGPLKMPLLRRLSTRTFEVLVDLKTLIITEKRFTLEIIDPWQLSGKSRNI